MISWPSLFMISWCLWSLEEPWCHLFLVSFILFEKFICKPRVYSLWSLLCLKFGSRSSLWSVSLFLTSLTSLVSIKLVDNPVYICLFCDLEFGLFLLSLSCCQKGLVILWWMRDFSSLESFLFSQSSVYLWQNSWSD